MYRMTLRVDEVAKLLGIGRSAAYAAVRRGEIPSLQIGDIILIPRAALEQMLGAPVPQEEVQCASATLFRGDRSA